MANEKKEEKPRRRIFGAAGPYRVSYEPPPRTVAQEVMDNQSGVTRVIQKRAPLGLETLEMVFRPIPELGKDYIDSLRLVEKERSTSVIHDNRVPTHILVIEPNDADYGEKIGAIETSPLLREGWITDLEQIRHDRWQREIKEKSGQRDAAYSYYCKIFDLKSDEAAAKKINEKKLLLHEIFADCNAEVERREKQEVELAQTPPGARPKEAAMA